MEGTHARKTNLELINERIQEFGENSIRIHPLPRTDFWLVYERIGDSNNPTNRITICDPHKTTRRIIYQGDSTAPYEEVWYELIKAHVTNTTINKMTKEYKKVINNNPKYAKHQLHYTNSERKNRSKKSTQNRSYSKKRSSHSSTQNTN